MYNLTGICSETNYAAYKFTANSPMHLKQYVYSWNSFIDPHWQLLPGEEQEDFEGAKQ